VPRRFENFGNKNIETIKSRRHSHHSISSHRRFEKQKHRNAVSRVEHSISSVHTYLQAIHNNIYNTLLHLPNY
jgi:hypothetical protein